MMISRADGTGRRTLLLVALACALGAVAPAAAGAQSGVRQSSELLFDQEQPGVPTGLTLSIDYVNPDDPSAKPPAVRTVVEELAAGAQIDTSVPDLCTANDAQLTAQGADACPDDSRVGSGFVRVDTGFPEPGRFIDADVVFLNNTDELILVSTARGSGARVITRAAVQGRQIVTNLAALPGTPPDGGAIDVVDFRLEAISREIDGSSRGYITTPPDCPPDGVWTNSISFTYSDGVTQLVDSQSPCAGSSVAASAASSLPPHAAATGSPAAAAKKCKKRTAKGKHARRGERSGKGKKRKRCKKR